MISDHIRWQMIEKKVISTCINNFVFRSAKKIPKEELKKILEEKIKDPSIRQYVLMELKIQ